MDCPGENTLARWLEGKLTGPQAAGVEQHLDDCAECRTLIASAARSWSGAPESEPKAQAPAPELRPGAVIAGKYRIERIAGAGGMGVVASAEHLALRQRVALKFIKPAALGDATAVVRFVREARAAVRLSGPHVARVLDLGTLESGAPYIVMEHLDGEDLGAHLEAAGPLDPGRAVELLLEACEGVAEAHDAGLIHRDLKPSNLFLARQPGGKVILKVLDFGLAKPIDAAAEPDLALTHSAATMGSPLYAAPEQLLSARDVDQRVDIWALGVIAYEMLAGRLPFAVGTLPQVVAQVLHSSPPSLATLRPELPRRLVATVERCLARDPADRFASARALAAALESAVAETPRRRWVVPGLAAAAAGVALAVALAVPGARSSSPALDPGADAVPAPPALEADAAAPRADAAAEAPRPAAETTRRPERRVLPRDPAPRPRADAAAGRAAPAPATDAGPPDAAPLSADELLDPR